MPRAENTEVGGRDWALSRRIRPVAERQSGYWAKDLRVAIPFSSRCARGVQDQPHRCHGMRTYSSASPLASVCDEIRVAMLLSNQFAAELREAASP